MSYVMIGTYMTRLGDPSVLYDYLITQIRLTLFYRMSNPLPIHQDELIVSEKQDLLFSAPAGNTTLQKKRRAFS